MVIPSPVIKLNYDPAGDVLSVEWPDFRDYTVGAAAFSLDTVVETVKLYDVKYLLADTRKGVVDISEPEYKEIILKFAMGLAATRIQKIARVVTESTLREGPIHEVTHHARLSIPVRNFYSINDALGWLTSKYDCLY